MDTEEIKATEATTAEKPINWYHEWLSEDAKNKVATQILGAYNLTDAEKIAAVKAVLKIHKLEIFY